jgi:hypothetical protein
MSHHPDLADPEAFNPRLEQIHEAAPPPKPTRLSDVDHLRLENISLKLLSIGHQFEKLTAARAGFSRQFDELRKECLVRYGIDIAVTRIDEEGNFLHPNASPAQPGLKVPA